MHWVLSAEHYTWCLITCGISQSICSSIQLFLAEDFNDDSLGRSLDDLYQQGVTEVFARVASRALKVYEIEHRSVHLDSSSFHLHGQYETGEPNTEAISITHGYSRDHRPDLKQVVVQLITS